MANYLEISHLNPLNFVDKDRELPLAYNFKHFDEWKGYEQKLKYQQGKCWHQVWQKDDIIFLQFKGNYDPIRLRVVNAETNVEVYQLLMDIVTTSDVDTNAIYFQAQLALNTLEEGYYKVIAEAGGDPIQKTLESETFHVKEEHPCSLLLKYSNAFNENIMYETGIYFLMRIQGVIADFQPGSSVTTYVDQPRNLSTVRGDVYRLFKLYVGHEGGVPDWFIDKLQEVFVQTSVEIDGKGFAANVGAKFVTTRIERYLYAQWNIEIGETNNSRVKRFESDGLVPRRVAIDYAVSLRLFGPVEGEANDNTANIQEIT